MIEFRTKGVVLRANDALQLSTIARVDEVIEHLAQRIEDVRENPEKAENERSEASPSTRGRPSAHESATSPSSWRSLSICGEYATFSQVDMC